MLGDTYQRHDGYFNDLIPGLVYGISDTMSLFFNVPVATGYKDRTLHSSGFEDIFLQFEYAYYVKNKKRATNQATVVANISCPTGSSHKKPPTGYGAPAYFIGTTYNHTAVDWLYFGSLGALFPSSHGSSRTANQYLYECGFGRNIASSPAYIFSWMVECDGIYGGKNKVQGKQDPNSGGNVIYVTPSLWLSTEKLILQLGAGGILTQHLYGNQTKYTYQVIFNLGWTF